MLIHIQQPVKVKSSLTDLLTSFDTAMVVPQRIILSPIVSFPFYIINNSIFSSLNFNLLFVIQDFIFGTQRLIPFLIFWFVKYNGL